MPEVRMSEEPICDFCSHRAPSRTFHCPDFTMDPAHPEVGVQEYRSLGDWMACSTCGALIDAGKWEELASRATARLRGKYALPERIIREQVRRSHELFREHWRPAK